jgi:tRNA pseudouridine55 synthase
VRQLVAGLGDAYCEELERTAIGEFQLEDADPERVVPLEEALSFMPEQRLTEEAAERVRHGVAVPAESASSHPDAVRLTVGERLLAIARPDGDLLKPFVVFPE